MTVHGPVPSRRLGLSIGINERFAFVEGVLIEYTYEGK